MKKEINTIQDVLDVKKEAFEAMLSSMQPISIQVEDGDFVMDTEHLILNATYRDDLKDEAQIAQYIRDENQDELFRYWAGIYLEAYGATVDAIEEDPADTTIEFQPDYDMSDLDMMLKIMAVEDAFEDHEN